MPTFRRFLALLVAVGALVIPSDAPAAVLCKKKSGVIAVRDTCKAKETRLDPDALGLRGASGVKGDKGDPGQQGADGSPGSPGATGPMGPALVVKDANGAFVGLLPDIQNRMFVRRVGDILLRLQVDPNYNPSTGSPALFPSLRTGIRLYYTSTDCSGAALSDDDVNQYNGSNTYSETYMGLGGTIIYIAGTSYTAAANSKNDNSSLQPTNQADCDAQYGPGNTGFAPPDQCCRAIAAYTTLFSPLSTIDSAGAALGLVPPFHVEGP